MHFQTKLSLAKIMTKKKEQFSFVEEIFIIDFSVTKNETKMNLNE